MLLSQVRAIRKYSSIPESIRIISPHSTIEHPLKASSSIFLQPAILVLHEPFSHSGYMSKSIQTAERLSNYTGALCIVPDLSVLRETFDPMKTSTWIEALDDLESVANKYSRFVEKMDVLNEFEHADEMGDPKKNLKSTESNIKDHHRHIKKLQSEVDMLKRQQQQNEELKESKNVDMKEKLEKGHQHAVEELSNYVLHPESKWPHRKLGVFGVGLGGTLGLALAARLLTVGKPLQGKGKV